MKKGNTSIAAAVAALLFGALCLQAAPQTFDGYKTGRGMSIEDYYDYSDMPDTESQAQMKRSINAALESHRQRIRQAPKEVADGLQYTVRALHALRNDNIKLAQESLKAATELFKTALTNDPRLDMVPVADDIEVDDIAMTPGEVTDTVDRAKIALEAHRTQEARRLLEPLKEEVTVVTVAVPMALYPKTTEQALNALQNGQKNQALKTLRDGFTTLVNEEMVLPLPLLKSQAFADAASRLEKGAKAQTLVAHARAEFENAMLLGYANPQDADYKKIGETLQTLEKRLGSGGETGMLYKSLDQSFDAIMQKAENGLYRAP